MRLVKAINGKLEADTGGRHLSYVCKTTTEVAGLREVLLAQFVFLDLRSTLKNLLSFGTTDGDVDSDRLITANVFSGSPCCEYSTSSASALVEPAEMRYLF